MMKWTRYMYKKAHLWGIRMWLPGLLAVAAVCQFPVVGNQYAMAESANEEDVDVDEDEETKLTISAAGDCTFGSDRMSSASVNFYSVYKKKKDPAYFFAKVKKIFARDDMTIVNFEGTLTRRNTRMPKKFAFKGDPSYVKILKKGSIEAVGFANNHCRDFGNGSYVDTINAFKGAGIVYSSYSKVGIYKVRGKKIGMVSVNGLERAASVRRLIQGGMKKLKEKKADLCIVSMHAGIEHNYSLSEMQKAIARYAVDKGADLVLGHHPHNLQGIEKYKGVYIVYSLGNFCFGGNTNPSDKDTMIFQQTFLFRKGKKKASTTVLDRKKSAARVVSCTVSSVGWINNYQPALAKGKTKERILKKLDNMCRPLGVTLRDGNGRLTPNVRRK